MEEKKTQEVKVETVRVTAAEQEKKEAVFKIDKDTVLFMLYLLYKANIFSRRHLKDFLKIIDQPLPENVAKYIVEEAGKVS